MLLALAALGLAGCSVGVDRPGFSAGMGTFAERFEIGRPPPEVICPPPDVAGDVAAVDPACVRPAGPPRAARPAPRAASRPAQ